MESKTYEKKQKIKTWNERMAEIFKNRRKT